MPKICAMNVTPRGHLSIINDSSIEYSAIVNTEAFFLCVAISQIAIKATFISLLQLVPALLATYTPGRLFIFKAEISIVSICLELV